MAFGRVLQVYITSSTEENAVPRSYEKFHIDVDVQRSILSEMNSAKITVYNLGQAEEDSINTLDSVLIKAGYKDGQTEIIFSGIVFEVKTRREEVDRILELECVTTTRSVQKVGQDSYRPRSLLLKNVEYNIGFGYDKIIEEICQFANLEFMPLASTPTRESDGKSIFYNDEAFSASGSVESLLGMITKKIKPLGYSIFIDNNQCVLFATSGSTPLAVAAMTEYNALLSIEKSRTVMKKVTTTLSTPPKMMSTEEKLKWLFDMIKTLRELLAAWNDKRLAAPSQQSYTQGDQVRLNQGRNYAKPEWAKCVNKAKEFMEGCANLFGANFFGAPMQVINDFLASSDGIYTMQWIHTGGNQTLTSAQIRAPYADNLILGELMTTRQFQPSTFLEFLRYGLGALTSIENRAKRAAEESRKLLAEQKTRLGKLVGIIQGIIAQIDNRIALFTGPTKDDTTIQDLFQFKNPVYITLPGIWDTYYTTVGGQNSFVDLYQKFFPDLAPGGKYNPVSSIIAPALNDIGYLTSSYILLQRHDQGELARGNLAVGSDGQLQLGSINGSLFERFTTLQLRDIVNMLNKLKALFQAALNALQAALKDEKIKPSSITTEQASHILYTVKAMFHPLVRPNGILTVPYETIDERRPIDPDGILKGSDWNPLALLVEAVEFKLSNWQDNFGMIVEGSITPNYIMPVDTTLRTGRVQKATSPPKPPMTPEERAAKAKARAILRKQQARELAKKRIADRLALHQKRGQL
jgi:hypothetical protein